MNPLTSWLDPMKWILVAALIGSSIFGFKYWEHRLIEQGRELERSAQLIESAKITAKANIKVQEIDRAYQKEKSKRVAAVRAVADARRLYDEANSRVAAASVPAGGIDDPRPAIASEAIGQLVALDEYAGQLAGKVEALQRYAREVCAR